MSEEQGSGGGRLKSTQDFGAGLFLIAIGLFALWQGWRLPMGTLRSMGAGMLPVSLAVMLCMGGFGLVISSFLQKGADLEAWSLRGLCFIVGGVVAFAFTIQSLGLLFAGPLAMIIGSMASEEFDWKEAIIFSIILTAACALLFKTALGLPIPVNVFW
jgi:putative tricarboxylic transport membrane protein